MEKIKTQNFALPRWFQPPVFQEHIHDQQLEDGDEEAGRLVRTVMQVIYSTAYSVHNAWHYLVQDQRLITSITHSMGTIPYLFCRF